MEVLLILEGADFRFNRGEFSGDYRICSVNKVCPYCCALWCTMTTSQLYHYAQSASCERCSNFDPSDPVPGSLITESWKTDHCDWDLLEHLPRELLEREFRLTLKAHNL